MSCNTLNAQPIRLTVTVGTLPEGYCPETFQQFANDFATRLIVTPNQNNSTFAIGSIEPTSNVGPWLKNCLEWYVFDDSTGRYIPISKGGFDSMQYHVASGAFIVPDSIFRIKVHAWGAGGGGADNGGAGAPSTGGGGGAFGMAIKTVTPGQVISFTVGSGGTNGTPTGNPGGTTTILGMTAGGGSGGSNVAAPPGGIGGVAVGFDMNVNGGPGISAVSGPSGTPGGPGGDSPQGGAGGSFRENQAGIVPGGGGGGCVPVTGTGGLGAGGAILIEF